MKADELLGRLQGVRQSGRGWEAHCPAHEDRKPSLTIAVGESGALLLRCHAGAGCPLDKIVAAIGITKADLFPGRATRGTRDGRRRIVATYD